MVKLKPQDIDIKKAVPFLTPAMNHANRVNIKELLLFQASRIFVLFRFSWFQPSINPVSSFLSSLFRDMRSILKLTPVNTRTSAAIIVKK